MAKQRFKGALNEVSFPMVSILQTRTVVQPQYDVNVRTPRNPSSTEDYSDYSMPQLLYCENVVPTGEGLQSVGYRQVVAGLPANSLFDQAITLRDADENNFLFAPAGGLNYIFTGIANAWVSTNPITGAAASSVTRAYVNGRTFICYEALGIYEYDSVANTFNKKVIIYPPGITESMVLGIGGSSNYLIFFTKIQVYYSSLVDPLDFAPSFTTGAGNSIPQDVKGQIVAVLGIAGGFIIYTTKNAVAAVYTNNSRSPFTYKEVNNAGGILSYEQVTSDQNPGPHYAWTTGGLQKITVQGAEAVSAEVSDFIAGKMWEYFDAAAMRLILVKNAASEFTTKLTFISSRWLIISYNTTDTLGTFNYALVYDTVLKRWGKLKIDHVDCFSYPYPNLAGILTYDALANTTYDALVNTTYDQLNSGINPLVTSKLSVAFMSANGKVELMEMDYNKITQQAGVVIFGKFQFIRNNLMTLQQLELEGLYQGDGIHEVRVHATVSFNGNKPDYTKEMVKISQDSGYARYAKRLTGVNANIIVAGTFALSSYLLEVTQDGDR